MKKILNHITAVTLLVAFASGAQAQSLDALGSKSVFVSRHFEPLMKHKVRTVYASTKDYCPSSWRWSKKDNSPRIASEWKRDVRKKMSTAGFGKAQIQHCTENSGFVFKGLQLTPHDKHKTYKGFSLAGVMVMKAKATGQKTAAPVLVRTRVNGEKGHQILNAKFQKICDFSADQGIMKINCQGLGQGTGRASREKGGRTSASFSTATHDVLFVTGRTVSYALNRLK